MINKDRSIGIVAYAETKIAFRGGRSAYELASEALSSILESTGLELSDIDGLAVADTMSDTANPFWPAYIADMLGLSPTWLEALSLGGVSAIGGVARAVAAVEAGFCKTALVLLSDVQSSKDQSEQGGQRFEFQYPTGLRGPAGVFGLLMQRYAYLHNLDPKALAKLAVTQRNHALLNENACDKLKKPLTEEDYINSRLISDPLRLLDCVMVCDGANAILVASPDVIKEKQFKKVVYPTAYAEVTNYKAFEPEVEITESGFMDVGPRALAQADLTASDIRMFHPYDDFLIAIQMQLEQIGFCGIGEGAQFILETDLSYDGQLPLNTGGGQISAGQPGLAGGGVNLVEAVRQMFGEANGRQVASPTNAMVTGIGVIPIGRNWSTSAAMILEQ